MKFNIGLCLMLIAAVCSCVFAADETQSNGIEKKTEKRGIYGGLGYGHYAYAPAIISHGHSIGHYGGYGGYSGGYHGGFGGLHDHYPSYIGGYHGGYHGGFYPGYYGGIGHHGLGHY